MSLDVVWLKAKSLDTVAVPAVVASNMFAGVGLFDVPANGEHIPNITNKTCASGTCAHQEVGNDVCNMMGDSNLSDRVLRSSRVLSMVSLFDSRDGTSRCD